MALREAADRERDAGLSNSERVCRNFLGFLPQSAKSLAYLGDLERKEGKLFEAAASYRRAAILEPDNAKLLNRLGHVLVRLARLDEALEVLQRCIQIKPDHTQAHIAISAVLRSQGKFEDARTVLEEGVRRMPYIEARPRKAPTARILRLRAAQNAYFTLLTSRSGQKKITLRRGNFSDRRLLRNGKYAIFNYIVMNKNILSADPVPEHDIIVNSIADPDVEADALRDLSAFLDQGPHAPVINHPDQVLKTSRDQNYRRLSQIEGVVFPKTVRFQASDQPQRQVAELIEANGFSYPMLLRKTGTHTGSSFVNAESEREMADLLEPVRGQEAYLIQYVDNRMKGRYFRKMRTFCVDGRLYPVICHIDEVWNVHGTNRKEIMLREPWMMDEEQSFLSDCKAYMGEQRYKVLTNVIDVIGLEYFAIDFDLLPDGRVLIFELNPAVRHHFDHADEFPYIRPYLEAVSNAFDDMIVSRLQTT